MDLDSDTQSEDDKRWKRVVGRNFSNKKTFADLHSVVCLYFSNYPRCVRNRNIGFLSLSLFAIEMCKLINFLRIFFSNLKNFRRFLKIFWEFKEIFFLRNRTVYCQSNYFIAESEASFHVGGCLLISIHFYNERTTCFCCKKSSNVNN